MERVIFQRLSGDPCHRTSSPFGCADIFDRYDLAVMRTFWRLLKRHRRSYFRGTTMASRSSSSFRTGPSSGHTRGVLLNSP